MATKKQLAALAKARATKKKYMKDRKEIGKDFTDLRKNKYRKAMKKRKMKKK